MAFCSASVPEQTGPTDGLLFGCCPTAILFGVLLGCRLQRRIIGASWATAAAGVGGGRSSLQGAGQQNADQNGLFGNRQTNADLLRLLFGQHSPTRLRFCSAPLLPSLVGGPDTCQDMVRVTADIREKTKKIENGEA